MIGSKIWAIPGGCIPDKSSGPEPLNTSRDTICILNVNDSVAHIRATIYYPDRDPVGPYLISVESRRVRHIRFNDLIDPEPILLDTIYAALIESDIPVVIQFTRVDTSTGNMAICSTMAFPV